MSTAASHRLEPLEPRLLMAVHTVLNNSDDGYGSLRQAIAAAVNGDTIELTALSGTITLGSPLTVNKHLTFRGPGEEHLTITGWTTGIRAMDITSTGAVTITDLRFANNRSGANGGAIRSAGYLALNRVTFAGNVGKGGGGAILQSGGQLSVVDCTFSNNTVTVSGINAWGGAIGVSGATLSIVNSAFWNNHAEGGTISLTGNPGPDAFGGALAVSGASNVTLLNSSFGFNYARGGTNTASPDFPGRGYGGAIALAAGVSGTITHCTIASNRMSSGEPIAVEGGGIHSQAEGIVYTNNLIANNWLTGADAGDVFSLHPITSNGGNYIGVADGLAGAIATDHVGTFASPKAVTLDIFRSTGGHTETRIPTSEIRDLGVWHYLVPSQDARGKDRVGAPDPGAVELQGDTVAGYGNALWLDPGGFGALVAPLTGTFDRTITISADVYITGASARNVIFNSGQSAANHSITLEYDAAAGAVKFRLLDGDGQTIVNLVAPLALSRVKDRWVSLYARFNGIYAEVYADARLIGRADSLNGNPIGHGSEYIGTLGGVWADRMFVGGLDNVRILNTAYSPLDVSASVSVPGTLGWWRFNEPTSSTFTRNWAEPEGYLGIDLSMSSGVRRVASDVPVRFFLRQGWRGTLRLPAWNPESADDSLVDLSYDLVSTPTQVSFPGDSIFAGYLEYMLTGAGTGTDSFIYRVAGYTSWSNPVTATIYFVPAPAAPVMSSDAPPAATAETPYSFTFAASDVNGDPIALSAGGLPAWLTFVDNGDGTATLSGTPTNAHAGTGTIVVHAYDGISTADFSLGLTVNAINHAPVLVTGFTPAAVTSEQPFTRTIGGDDEDGDALSFVGIDLPAWLTLTDNGNGTATLSGTPTNAHAGEHVVTVRVSDGTDTAEQSFTITVAPVNHAPAFVGSAPPSSVYFNAAYHHTIQALDADGDPLQISATGLPHWLSLVDHGNGTATLSGTPTETAATTYAIVLRAGDGAVLTGQTLNLQVIVPKYRLNDDGVLTIAGTLANDNLQVFVRDGQLRLVHNWTIRHFPLASVTKIEAHGFSGNDTISIAAPANVPTYVLGGGGNDALTGGDQPDNLVGGGGKDHLIGNSGDDRLSGGLGHDYLLGGGHKDRLYGGDGNDTLHGGTGADRLYGDGGDDVLFARDRYIDLLTGGAGADTAQTDAIDRGHDLFALIA